MTDILQEACPGDGITKGVVLAPGEAILFFTRHLLKEGLLYSNAQDIEHNFRGPVSWARKTVQVQVTINTMQESCWAISDAIMEKKTKVRGPGCTWGLRGAAKPSATACNVDDWKWDLDEGVCNREVGRTHDVYAHRYEWGNTCKWHADGDGRWCRWQGTPGVSRCFSGGSPSSWGGSSDPGSNWNSVH